jgi:hypothetical protein
MRRLSLGMRRDVTNPTGGDVSILLVRISHPDLTDDILLSSDPTELLSLEPLVYGTKSNEESYYFSLMSFVIPDQQEGQGPSTQIVFEQVSRKQVDMLRSTRTPPSISMYVVQASSPDFHELDFANFLVSSGTYGADRITLKVERKILTTEPWPCDRMSRQNAPGLL